MGVVTDTKVFLLDEDYIRDGSESVESTIGTGQSRNHLVDSAELKQIVQIQAANADLNAITVVSSFALGHRWRLRCRDGGPPKSHTEYSESS